MDPWTFHSPLRAPAGVTFRLCVAAAAVVAAAGAWRARCQASQAKPYPFHGAVTDTIENRESSSNVRDSRVPRQRPLRPTPPHQSVTPSRFDSSAVSLPLARPRRAFNSCQWPASRCDCRSRQLSMRPPQAGSAVQLRQAIAEPLGVFYEHGATARRCRWRFRDSQFTGSSTAVRATIVRLESSLTWQVGGQQARTGLGLDCGGCLPVMLRRTSCHPPGTSHRVTMLQTPIS